MKNFCLYNGKKTVKSEIWNITSVELSGDYTSAIIQAESKSNKSEYTLDITPLISNQYENGIDPYSSTIVNELTGVSDWILDPDNNSIIYYVTNNDSRCSGPYYAAGGFSGGHSTVEFCNTIKEGFGYSSVSVGPLDEECRATCTFNNGDTSLIYGIVVGEGEAEKEEKTILLDVVAQQVISNAESGDTNAQNSIISTFNNITDGILTSDYSEFFEQNKQPK